MKTVPSETALHLWGDQIYFETPGCAMELNPEQEVPENEKNLYAQLPEEDAAIPAARDQQ